MSASPGFKPENPLIVQGDHTILAEVASPRYAAARDGLARFAELLKAPEHVHTYRVTPLSIWNACASGATAGEIAGTLVEFSKYPVPEHVLFEIRDYASRYGRVKLLRDGRGLVLAANEEPLAEQIARSKHVAPFLGARRSALEFAVDPMARGEIKQALIKIGFPAEDLAGYSEGEALPMALRETTRSGQPFSLRPYQREAAEAFYAAGAARGGSGVITLPCGAGKTIVAMACMERLQTSTLVLTTSVTAARQWISELLDKTSLHENRIAEYSGDLKQVREVTIATYQIMTWRPNRESGYPHLKLFESRNWGLIIYDEVHLLPAPVFRDGGTAGAAPFGVDGDTGSLDGLEMQNRRGSLSRTALDATTGAECRQSIRARVSVAATPAFGLRDDSIVCRNSRRRTCTAPRKGKTAWMKLCFECAMVASIARDRPC